MDKLLQKPLLCKITYTRWREALWRMSGFVLASKIGGFASQNGSASLRTLLRSMISNSTKPSWWKYCSLFDILSKPASLIFHKIPIFLSLCEENMRVLEICKITLRRAYEGTFVFLVSKNGVPAQDGYYIGLNPKKWGLFLDPLIFDLDFCEEYLEANKSSDTIG